MNPVTTPRGELHLRLDAHQAEALADFAARSHLPANGAARVLLERGLESFESLDPERDRDLRAAVRTVGLIALAGLVATEQARHLISSMFGERQAKLLAYGPEALAAAKQRLESLEGTLKDYSL